MEFHPHEAQTLLTGCGDGAARASDCRETAAHRAWRLGPEVERVTWDRANPYCFAVSISLKLPYLFR